jgi:glycosyltransferase involved in cell wall biosynthesis
LGPAQCYLHSYCGLRRLIEEFQPDVIDLWEEPWALVSVQVCWLRNRYFPDVRFISETEQNVEKRLPSPFEQFRKYVLRNANFVVGRNSQALEIVRRKGYRGEAQVVPNAVDSELFRPMNRQDCRRQLGLDGFLVGYVGRFVEEKGLADLIEAVRQSPKQVHAVFVGDGPMRSFLQRRAEEASLRDRVHVLPARPLEQLPCLMNALDVLVLPSRTTHRWKEQFGRVIIEAHACGVPVIGSSSGAIPEVVGDGGIIFPETNVVNLTGAIKKLMNNPQLRSVMGETGLAAVKQRFTWQRVAERMENIYRRTLDDNPVSRPVPIAI